VLVALAVFMIWRLYDLLQAKGWWTQEFNTERKTSAQAEIEEQKRKLKELEETLKEVEK
jgi:hypothetical protein